MHPGLEVIHVHMLYEMDNFRTGMVFFGPAAFQTCKIMHDSGETLHAACTHPFILQTECY